MNVFVRELAGHEIDPEPDESPTKLVVEDNVGEAIHLHWRNVRLEMSIEDFRMFADHITDANEVIDRGNR